MTKNKQGAFQTVNAMSTFRFALDEGIRRGLSPLAKGRHVDQKLIDEAWHIVISEIMNVCDQHSTTLSEKAVTWLADSYFRLAIKLKLDDGTNAFDSTNSTNSVSTTDLTDDDLKTLSRHLKGSIFESEVNDEQRKRTHQQND